MLNSGKDQAAHLRHLAEAVRPYLAMDEGARLGVLQTERWIDYERAAAVLERMTRLLETPPRERMPCMLLHGESNLGKTQIVRKFMRQHPPTFDARRGVEHRQIIGTQMPALPDHYRFYSALLFEIGAPHNPKAGVAALETLARSLLRTIKPRMLIVDEAHHLLAGSHREQRASMNLVKYLANDLQMAVVLVGTADAKIALQTDAQMSSRFPAVELPRWGETEEFRKFLHAFERLLPLKQASVLAQREIVQYVLAATGGITGAIAAVLTGAAAQAIRDGSERVTLRHLEHAAATAI